MKQFDLALADFTSALQGDPKFGSVYLNRGHTYTTMKQYALVLSYTYCFSSYQALADYDKAIEIEPTNEVAYNNRAFNYNEMKEHELALNDSRKAISIAPSYANAYVHAATALLALGKLLLSKS